MFNRYIVAVQGSKVHDSTTLNLELAEGKLEP